MGIFQELGKLRDAYIEGKLTDTEYDAARALVFQGESIEETLLEIECQRTGSPHLRACPAD